MLIGVIAWLLLTGTAADLLAGRLYMGEAIGKLSTLTTIFLGIFIEAAAFLLLGTFVSAFIQEFVTPYSNTYRVIGTARLSWVLAWG